MIVCQYLNQVAHAPTHAVSHQTHQHKPPTSANTSCKHDPKRCSPPATRYIPNPTALILAMLRLRLQKICPA